MSLENAPVKAPRGTHLERRVAQLAKGMPELEDLTPAQVDKIAQGVAVDELKAEMRRAIVAERVDFGAEREAFLSDARSPHTREAYARALGHLGTWLELHALPAANLTPRLADDFIRDLRAMSGKDADSTRLVVSACSSFFSFLERRFDEIRNPFRGSRARPASTWTEAVIPSAAELKILQEEAEPALAAALAVAIETGLRVGGLPGLTIREDGTWHTVSKAHRLQAAEPLSASTLRAVGAAGLDPRRPFDPATFPREPGRGYSETAPEDLLIAWLKTRLARLCAHLMLDGRIAAVYSWHDLRHAFAERNAARGLVWLRDRLGHSGVAVTERYLRNVLNADTREM
ncbi:MAG: site-specific integrase [Spirochaetes bacterium]|nr:site-specific integrase [Spirochaetota bacterium]